MYIETSCSIIACLLTAGIAFFILSGIKKTITKLDYGIWTIQCILNVVAAVLLFVNRSTDRVGGLVIWTLILSAGGFIAFSYAVRYETKIVGIYSAITAVVCLISVLIKPMDVTQAVGTDLFIIIYLILLFTGVTAMVVLCSLCVVASKRPIKIKRWIRFSYLFLGLTIFSGCIIGYRTIGFGSMSIDDYMQIVTVASFLILCAYLHGIKSYTKAMCIVPLGVMAFGMAAVYFFPLAMVMLIAAGVILKKRSNIKINWKIEYKNPMKLFRASTYAYVAATAVIMIIDKIIMQIGGILLIYNIPSFLYGIITSVYGIVLVAAWILSREQQPIITYAAIIVWNTLFTLSLLLLYSSPNVLVVFLIWCLLLPISFFIITCKRSYKDSSAVKQVFLSLLMIGIAASYGLSTEYVDTMKNTKSEFTIEGRTIGKEQIKADQMLIIHKLEGDYQVNSIMASENCPDISIITYCSRPMIYFFWIGCLGILGYSAMCIIKKKV